MEWYTCARCPPHSIKDHTIYGDKRCLMDGCPCPGYLANPKDPVKSTKKSVSFSKLYLTRGT